MGASATDKLTTYTYAANGFAATLTGAQAGARSQRPGVSFVVPDQIRTIQTDGTPDFLGLTAEDGPWASGLTGEDVIIGVIDTGIWPEHPSFSDHGGFSFKRRDIAAYSGRPARPRQHGSSTRRRPVRLQQQAHRRALVRQGSPGDIGAGLAQGDFLSARDHDGHGTHTASTAGGNRGVDPVIFGRDSRRRHDLRDGAPGPDRRLQGVLRRRRVRRSATSSLPSMPRSPMASTSSTTRSVPTAPQPRGRRRCRRVPVRGTSRRVRRGLGRQRRSRGRRRSVRRRRRLGDRGRREHARP